MRRPGRPDRPRPQREDQPAQRLRPEELLLPGPAAGLPDLAVQAAGGGRRHRHGGHAGRRADRRRHRAAPSGAGRRQVDPRPARHDELGRPQPVRRGADGDRVEARPPHGRRGQGVRLQAPDDPALSRHLRRRHGERQSPRRRERFGAAPRRAARYPLRDQERQLDPLPRHGDRIRGAAAGRRHRGRRHDRAGDAAVRSRSRRDPGDADEGGGARLPLLPRSRSSAARDRPGFRRCAGGGAAGVAGREARAIRRRARAQCLRCGRSHRGEGERRVLRGGGHRPRRQGSRQLGDQRPVRTAEQGREGDRIEPGVGRSARRHPRPDRGTGDLRQDRQGRLRHRLGGGWRPAGRGGGAGPQTGHRHRCDRGHRREDHRRQCR